MLEFTAVRIACNSQYGSHVTKNTTLRKYCTTTAPVYSMHHILLTGLFPVGEEDEVSIKEVEDMIASALEFTGEIHVSTL